MKSLLALFVALVFEALTTWAFFHRIQYDTNDGDIGLGLLFWAMVALYLLIDGAWLGVLVWRGCR